MRAQVKLMKQGLEKQKTNTTVATTNLKIKPLWQHTFASIKHEDKEIIQFNKNFSTSRIVLISQEIHWKNLSIYK